MMRLAQSPRALGALGAVAFAESSFFPLPPDLMLVPMVLAHRRQAFAMAATCTLASVTGGLLGYLIGFALTPIGQAILDFYGHTGAMAEFQALFARWGLWIILVKGLTPIPYKIVAIAAGMAHFDPAVFILASLLTRGLRFFLLAGLLYVYGEPIRAFIERWLTLVTTLFLLLTIGGIVATRYLF